MKLFDLFKFSKLLEIRDGQISLMNNFVNVIPTTILCEFQKELINSIGYENAYEKIYKAAKRGSIAYNREFIKKQGFSDKRKTLEWQIKIVTFAGWGNLKIILIDEKNDRYIVRFEKSPFPKLYGKTKFPVDMVVTGFTAGGVSATFNKDLDAVETKCIGIGDQFCEIEVGLPENIKKLKERHIKKWCNV